MYVHKKTRAPLAILLAVALMWSTLTAGFAYAADEQPNEQTAAEENIIEAPVPSESDSEPPALPSDAVTMNAVPAASPIVLIEDFEDLSDLYTSGAKANSVTLERQERPGPVMYGHASGKLSYDFTGNDGTSAAYVYFNKHEDRVLEDSPRKIGAWVFGDAGKHWLRAQLEDSTGARHVTDFTSTTGFNWNGWQYVTANVPQGLPLPIELRQIYIAELSANNKNSGTVYFEQVSAIYNDANPVTIELDGLHGMKPGDTLQASVLATASGTSSLTDVTAGSTFASSSDAVATVSASGLVQAVGLGSATITAVNGALTASYELVVSVAGAAPAGLELEASTVLERGESEPVRAYVYFAGNAEPHRSVTGVSFSNSAPGIAEVSADGVVTAIGTGSATITASYAGLTAAYTLTVNEPVPVLRSIRIAGLAPMTEGGKAQASVLATYKLLDEELVRDVTNEAGFRSLSPAIADVDANGLITAKAAGTAKIEYSYGSKKEQALVIVNAPQQPQKRELRAAWIASVENIDWPVKGVTTESDQKADFIELLDELAATGINAVIVQVKPTADAFYPSELAPWSEWLTGVQGKDPGYDPLAFMLDEVHKRGMEFHAWFNPYRISMHDDIGKLVEDHPAKLHPEWVETYGGKLYFNPGEPEAKAFVIDSVMEVVDNYDIDAVHFDDYFYPYPVSNTEFPDADEYAAYGEGFDNISAWRRNNVDTLIEGLAAEIKESKPYVKFGISPFGIWRNKATDPAGSETNGLQSYDALFADTKGWVEKGWLDYIAPQDYWHFDYSPAAYEKVQEWWRGVVDGENAHLYIGHAAYRVPTWTDSQELYNQIVYNRSFPETVHGSMFFSAKDVIANHLGMQDKLVADLYRYPALVPTMPWLDDEAPEAPALLTASSSRAGQIELRWKEAPAADDTSYFAVYRAEGTDAPNTEGPSQLIGTVRKQADEAVQSYLDMSAQSGQKYTYLVTALDRLHNESEASNAKTGVYAPGSVLKEKIMAKDAIAGTIELELSGVKKLASNVVIDQKLGGITVRRSFEEVMVGASNAEIRLNEAGEVEHMTLIGETERDTMRVGIRSSIADITDLTQLNHNRIELLASAPFRLVDKIGESTVEAAAGVPVIITSAEGKIVVEQNGAELLNTSNRVYAMPPADGSLIEVSSLTRAQGKPKYRGQLEFTLSSDAGKLRLVNELSLEQYLYQVVPSEMPASFGLEALKAQAIAARTYAMTDYLMSRFADKGFHIDDSTLSQVYNNSAENELTRQAVDATAGQIMLSGGMLVDARFYSTSGGYGASKHEVWSDAVTNKFPGTAIPYLTGKSYTFKPGSQEEMLSVDTSDEAAVSAFYKDLSLTGYDSDSLYFRWKVALTGAELTKTINNNIKLRYAADPLFILTKQADGSYASKPIPDDGIGKLLGMSVANRGAGGNITELLVEGTTGTYKIIKEFNIRFTIRPNKTNTESAGDILAYRAKGGSTDYDAAATLKNPSILYSAFFTFDITENEAGDIAGVTFYGGGNGHGAGMSQYGAQMLGKSGWTYTQILNAYYAGMKIVPLNAPIVTRLQVEAGERLAVGAVGKVSVRGIYSNGIETPVTSGIGYQSSDPGIVSVDDRGNVTAHRAGEATITVTVGALSATAAITGYIPHNPGPGSGPGTNPDPDGGAEEPGTDPEPEPEIKFSDIAKHWAKEAIELAVSLGMVTGFEDGTFRPDASVTRAQFVTLMMRAFPIEELSTGEQASFADADEIQAWAMEAVMAAAAAGYIEGYQDGTFRPADQISRSEIAALIVRFAGLEPIEGAGLPFEDGELAPGWARGYIAAAVEAGLMQGKGSGTFDPIEDASRAEAVVLLLSLLEMMEEA
ncbi:family 10 glycosylhydrolase [Paenibacillus soyae]|uniref:Family 10 glycosylhydrolase n=1 Tax=Paenibacillus soyae TaxID=2969249 RepID=A0A9X2MTY2_9BACL|nr:family 10 glycosylhydrolase [Paenibacillus soyae]MCR2806425.1 family 10 glycosylhydrolase [Paenibacillus soyae]